MKETFALLLLFVLVLSASAQEIRKLNTIDINARPLNKKNLGSPMLSYRTTYFDDTVVHQHILVKSRKKSDTIVGFSFTIVTPATGTDSLDIQYSFYKKTPLLTDAINSPPIATKRLKRANVAGECTVQVPPQIITPEGLVFNAFMYGARDSPMVKARGVPHVRVFNMYFHPQKKAWELHDYHISTFGLTQITGYTFYTR
jgi:hypothetical protein